MGNNNFNPKDFKDKCIGCAYLSWLPSHSPQDLEVKDEYRQIIVNNKLQKKWSIVSQHAHPANYYCHKRLQEDIFDDIRKTTDNVKRTSKILQVKCPKKCPHKDWQPHHDGISPQDALNREKHDNTRRWQIASFIAVVLSILATVFFNLTC